LRREAGAGVVERSAVSSISVDFSIDGSFLGRWRLGSLACVPEGVSTIGVFTI
jgi:hypothetical protein